MLEELTHDTSARQKPEAENGAGPHFRRVEPPKSGFIQVWNAFRSDRRLRQSLAAVVLAALAYYARRRQDGRVRPSHLAKLLGVPHTRVTRAYARLRRHGMLDADGWPVATLDAVLGTPDGYEKRGFQRLELASVAELGSIKLALDAVALSGVYNFDTVTREGTAGFRTTLGTVARQLAVSVKTAGRRLAKLVAAGVVKLAPRVRGWPLSVRMLDARERKLARREALKKKHADGPTPKERPGVPPPAQELPPHNITPEELKRLTEELGKRGRPGRPDG